MRDISTSLSLQEVSLQSIFSAHQVTWSLTNKEIIKSLKLTASLLELYGENQFKVRSYNTAVYNLERIEEDLTKLDLSQLNQLPGVGKSIAKIIDELNRTDSNDVLNNLLKQTPEGIMELMGIKGLGARKIKTAWDELRIESPSAMFQAAQQGQLAGLPGFGDKTQDRVLQMVKYHLDTQKKVHYKVAHLAGEWLESLIKKQFSNPTLSRSGEFRRKMEVVEDLEYLWASNRPWEPEEFLDNTDGLEKDPKRSGPFRWVGTITAENLPLDIRFCDEDSFGTHLLRRTGSKEHLKLTNKEGRSLWDTSRATAAREEDIYQSHGWPYLPPELREGLFEDSYAKLTKTPDLVSMGQLKGILHNHSTYSDGKHSLKDMAQQCKSLGYQYLGISDHSQTAVYANGLDEDQVIAQHQEIEAINEEMAPFKVFKGIESDILNDGSLDYPAEVLQNFDFIVASIHSNLNMDRKKATERLITAVENPFTTMLGHPTGRQLLKREGYPIDHKKVIDACAQYGVIIEINAHPWRLDLAWEWVHYALSKGVVISINPDAHDKAGLEDMYYGLCVGRKAGLTADMTFNARDVEELTRYFHHRKERAISKSLV